MIADAHPSGDLATTAADRRPITLRQERSVMLLYEILARTRMREDQHHASQARLAGRLRTARRWQRLARYADRQAHRATSRL
ncbi:MAG: hypothetical protein ACRDTE_19500 [Pseudonocardiaceae bacterium]